MFYPQGNFHSQGIGYPQGFGYPQGSFGQQGFLGTSNNVPFSNTLYGYTQPTPNFGQGLPQMSNWQHPAQQALQQAALQQQAMLHLLAPQLASPFAPQQSPFTQQQLQGTNSFPGLANGATQSTGVWQQPQAIPEQINPALLPQSQQQLLQRLAQYHNLVAQQLAQLAAQQTIQSPGNPFAGQFMPNQFVPNSGQYITSPLGANFVPGITMH